MPPHISIDEINAGDAWGAQASQRMNLEEADRAPEYELNEILWRSVRGSASVMGAQEFWFERMIERLFK
jgi:hypothetical protein